jgi:hypothetical protein
LNETSPKELLSATHTEGYKTETMNHTELSLGWPYSEELKKNTNTNERMFYIVSIFFRMVKEFIAELRK